MIAADMKLYDLFTIGEVDEYGQDKIDNKLKRQIKMAIYLSNQQVTDNIKYKDATYIGLTLDKDIDESNTISYNNKKLKILYCNTTGRYTQVYMSEIE